MQYELSYFEEVIQTTEPLSGLRVLTEKYSRNLQQLNAQTAAVLTRMIRQANAETSQRKTKRYVRSHQAALIILADRLLGDMHRAGFKDLYIISNDGTLENMCKHFFMAMSEILLFMENFLSKFFDMKIRIQDTYRVMCSKDMAGRLDFLKKTFTALEVDPALIMVFAKPYERYMAGEMKNEITFQRLLYLNNLLKDTIEEIEKLGAEKKDQDMTVGLLKHLVFQNFNSLSFLNYCTARWSRRILEAETIPAQLRKIGWLLKKNEQYHVRDGYALHHPRLDIVKLLKAWLEAEQCFMIILNQEENPEFESRRRMNGAEINGNAAKHRRASITTGIPVPQFGHMLALMRAEDILQSKNPIDLAETMASVVRSKDNEPISPASLRNYLFSVNRTTAEATRKRLHNMITLSKEIIP